MYILLATEKSGAHADNDKTRCVYRYAGEPHIKKFGGFYGVTIGENAIIGACTLVNKDILDGATAVGVPCRIIKKDNE